LTAIVTAGVEPYITHDTPLWLKAYFDETPSQDDPEEIKEGSAIRVPAEKTSVTPLDKQAKNQQFDFELTEEEFNADNFALYIWGEPYGYVALRHVVARETLAVGRLELKPQHCTKGGLPKPPRNALPGDEQILCEFEAVQSVVNFIVDEMNNNAKGPEMKKLLTMDEDRLRRIQLLNSFPSAYPVSKLANYFPLQDAKMYLACLTHSKKGDPRDLMQDIAFCLPGQNGGIWDHKPIIAPIWGEKNRLGNRGFAYFYDIWSNIHFGYIGAKAKISEDDLQYYPGVAQFIDNLQKLSPFAGDDPIDTESIISGINLGNKKIEKVCIMDVINIIERHPNWEFSVRFPKEEEKEKEKEKYCVPRWPMRPGKTCAW